MSHKTLFGSALLATMIGCSLFAARDAAADHISRTAHVSAPAHARSTVDRPSENFTRVYMGYGVLSIPSSLHTVDGKYDLVVHFHGGAFLQENNVEECELNAIVVSINLGISSGAYSDFGYGPRGLTSILERVQHEVETTGKVPGAHLGRVALSAWSAGFGAVGSILAERSNWPLIDAVLLADGLHSAYVGYKQIDESSIVKYADFAQLAMTNQKLFAITHSSIGTDGYASTTETTGELLHQAGVSKQPHASVGPDQMHEIYQVDWGSFHVKGFEGTEKQDHIDHITEMHNTLFPYLKARWEGN
jgi:hypothetical protein